METIEERANNAWFDYEYTGIPTFERVFKDGFKTEVQSEHDKLTARFESEIKAYQKAVKEGLEREKTAKDVIAEKRKEIARLTKWNEVDEELPEYYKVVEIKYRISGLSRISIA